MNAIKKIGFYLLTGVILIACTNKPKTLKQEFETIYTALETEYDSLETQEAKDSLLVAANERLFNLLMTHMGEEYSDTVFLEVFGLLEDEQIAKAFEAMPKTMLENEKLAKKYHLFQAVSRTSEGQKYIDFALPQVNGESISLSSLVGKTEYVLVDFWASWCGPCRRLLPVLKEIYLAQEEGKLQIHGVSVDKDEKKWLQALDEEQLPWYQVRDTMTSEQSPSDLYGVMYIPTTILIDKEGTIVARNPSEEELAEILQ